MADISGSDASDAEAPETTITENKKETAAETGKRNACMPRFHVQQTCLLYSNLS